MEAGNRLKKVGVKLNVQVLLGFEQHKPKPVQGKVCDDAEQREREQDREILSDV